MFVWSCVCVPFYSSVVHVHTSALYVRFCDLWCECGSYYAKLCQFCGCVLRGVIVVLSPYHWHAYMYVCFCRSALNIYASMEMLMVVLAF